MRSPVTHTYIYIYTYIHTYIYVYIYIYVCAPYSRTPQLVGNFEALRLIEAEEKEEK